MAQSKRTPVLTIDEVIRRQDSAHGAELYLLLQGAFYHAFNQAAREFHTATGYKVRTMPHGSGYIEQLGIPFGQLDAALCAFLNGKNVMVEYLDQHVRLTIL